MKPTPNNKRPIGPVPEAANHKYNELICIGADFPFSIATQGYIEIISKPGGKGYMPSAPELRNTCRLIGPIEIFHKVKAHGARAS